MREDMKHVLIDRPRGGQHYVRSMVRARPNRGRVGEEYEFYPKKQGMRRAWTGWRKSLSDHINPLKRYLEKQVGRAWDDVWSEICQRVDNDSVQGYHLRGHVNGYVERNVRMIDGVPHESQAHGVWVKVYGLYVNPETGILCWRRRDRFKYPKYLANPEVEIRLDDTNTLTYIHHGWFHVRRTTKVVRWRDPLTQLIREEKRVEERKRQISKRAVKALDLPKVPSVDFRPEDGALQGHKALLRL